MGNQSYHSLHGQSHPVRGCQLSLLPAGVLTKAQTARDRCALHNPGKSPRNLIGDFPGRQGDQRVLLPHSPRKRPHHIPAREGERGSAGSEEAGTWVSAEGVSGLPPGQPGVDVGRTQKTFLPTGLFPEFDFSVEVLPNFNNKKEKSISHRHITKLPLQERVFCRHSGQET